MHFSPCGSLAPPAGRPSGASPVTLNDPHFRLTGSACFSSLLPPGSGSSLFPAPRAVPPSQRAGSRDWAVFLGAVPFFRAYLRLLPKRSPKGRAAALGSVRVLSQPWAGGMTSLSFPGGSAAKRGGKISVGLKLLQVACPSVPSPVALLALGGLQMQL